ncbi:hypothetical protein PHYSODRAFT_496641 [Phytophthora sojae]|uniref:Temptin Cys/Cys disulfide domain-containing protein n=1 Tax=Phytophthora sojae (strain P6497) TaxID=1094619 RepID=G4Z4S2_PHYSP|nr:hypothetical protein PHYSODRAFT_496641 [Phytophthora sojae]EGZ21609.1 hypothetical protein PHYSODRAFT_496641 [Phytophthora sojae]|eukprot:XP_009524326.1 hypothetical protein PHYSODRAFT_496641 [Phytophthora sojae]
MKTARPGTLLLVAAAVATLSSVEVEAKEEFVKLIPNAARVPGVSAIGHTDGTGASSANNDFGKAFDSAGKVWTLDLCKADTDGDGQTNGQELGDPCCEWTHGAQPRWTSGVSHPSDATKTSNESLWAKIDCSNVTTIAASSAASPATGTASMVTIAALGVAAMLNLV